MEVLVYGSRKSGTTLLQRLLDGGDDLFVHPAETKIKFYINLEKRRHSSFEAVKTEDIWLYFKAKKKHWDKLKDDIYTKYVEENYKSVRSLADYIKLDIEASKAALSENGSLPSSWVIKEVSGETSEILNTFLNTYRKAKVLMIMRDPRWIASAIFREKRTSGTKISLKCGWSIAKEPYRTIREQATYIGHPHVMHIYFENLVHDTEKQMRKVCAFLDIPFTKNFLKPTINAVACVVPSSSRQTKQVFEQDEPLYRNLKTWEYLFIQAQSILNYRFIKAYKNGLIQGYLVVDRLKTQISPVNLANTAPKFLEKVNKTQKMPAARRNKMDR